MEVHMKNREYLLQTAPADILKAANARMIWLHCECILDTLSDDGACFERCRKFTEERGIDCNKCIESWLNEERRQI